MKELQKFGRRICIIGPSSTGKSTLAKSLGTKLNLKVCYLDQLAHIPNTQWQPRDKEELRIDHLNFVTQNEEWIIEGNYSYLMKERFSKATCIIWLDFNKWASLFRYLKRTVKRDERRPGNLEGAQPKLSPVMIKSILFRAPKSRTKYRKLIEESNVDLIHIHSFRELKRLYIKWDMVCT